MSDVHVKILQLRPDASLPSYATEHAAAADCHAAIDKPIILKPGERTLVPLGFALELPPGWEAQIRARSGLALKHGISMANGIGTIDADYRGEYGAILINLGHDDFIIEPDMRVAQMVIAKVASVEFMKVDTLSETARGAGGFGSTGK